MFKDWYCCQSETANRSLQEVAALKIMNPRPLQGTQTLCMRRSNAKLVRNQFERPFGLRGGDLKVSVGPAKPHRYNSIQEVTKDKSNSKRSFLNCRPMLLPETEKQKNNPFQSIAPPRPAIAGDQGLRKSGTDKGSIRRTTLTPCLFQKHAPRLQKHVSHLVLQHFCCGQAPDESAPGAPPWPIVLFVNYKHVLQTCFFSYGGNCIWLCRIFLRPLLENNFA